MIRVGAAIFFVLLCESQAQTAPCTKLGTPGTYIGKIVPTQFYGPPNFGEDPAHDERGIYPVLKLDHPLRLCEVLHWSDESDRHIVRKTQVIFLAPPYGANWNGKHVAVRGKLLPSENAYQHTPVMLDSTEVSAVP